MIRNEQLSIFKTRILTDIELCEHLLEVELRKKAIVERDMHQISTITERIDKDIQKLNGVIISIITLSIINCEKLSGNFT